MKEKLKIVVKYHLLFGECEARNVDGVEEKVSYNISCCSAGHLETGAKPLITAAVHHCVDPHVGQAVLGLSWLYADRAPQVMVATTTISTTVSSHTLSTVYTPPLPTPGSPWHPDNTEE